MNCGTLTREARRASARSIPVAAVRCCLVATLVFRAFAAQAGESCPATENVVVGSVLASSGQPLRDARVYVLLDRVSEKQTMKQGIRARSTRTDDSGRFELPIVCGAPAGQPDPCASKPRHLTVIVGELGMAMTLRQYKLSTIEMQRVGELCLIQAPPLALSGRP